MVDYDIVSKVLYLIKDGRIFTNTTEVNDAIAKFFGKSAICLSAAIDSWPDEPSDTGVAPVTAEVIAANQFGARQPWSIAVEPLKSTFG